MKIVRLKAEQLREWRTNVGHLVDDEGHLTGKLERPLEAAIATVVRSARSQRKTLEQRVGVGGREHRIVVTVTRTGMNADDLSLVPTLDGKRIVTGREVFAAKMLRQHGECQLRGPNGIILKVVRDPGVHRPTALESSQIAPRPEHCPCKNWGNPHPGTHYPTCHWNRLAPPDERAPTDHVPEDEVQLLPTEAFESLRLRPVMAAATHPMVARVDPRAVVVQAPEVDAPESCRNGCLDWATPPGFPIPDGQHHPTCHFAKAWAVKTARETPRWLVDLRDGKRVRLATNQEVGESEVQAQKTGSPLIHIEDVPYAVLLESELDRDAAEAVQTPLPMAAGAGG